MECITVYAQERKERPVIRRVKCKRKCWQVKPRKQCKQERVVW